MAEMNKEAIIKEYLSLFESATKLYKNSSFKKSQKLEIQTIYTNSFIGLLREGYEREIQKKNGKELVIITVNKSQYAFPTQHIKDTLGDEYDEVMGLSSQEDLLQEALNEVSNMSLGETDIKEDTPEYFEEGETKEATDFVYASYETEFVSVEDGEIHTFSYQVYPERIPRNKSDKIRTIVTVKGAKNHISIGNIGTTTRFKIGQFEMGAKCEVDNKTGEIICEPIFLGDGTAYKVTTQKVKDFGVTLGTTKNTHMIVTITGKDVHIFPMDYCNNDRSGCAPAVALLGDERQAIVPSEVNIIPVTADDNSRTNVRFFWKGTTLYYEI